MSGFRSGQGGGSPTDLKPRDSVTVQGTTPTITIGDGGDEDIKLLFNSNTNDYYVGSDATDDKLHVGVGSAIGTNVAITVDSSAQVSKLNLAAAAVAVADDHIVILDGGATGAPKAESIQDLLSAIAGSGLSVSGNQLVASGGGAADSVAADDISLGNAAVSLATSAGNITIDAQGNNTDIIFKGTDATSDITMLTLDGSEAGAATFNSTVTATGFTIGSAAITEAELEILDGASVTTTELNLIDGDTSRGTTAVADGDGFLHNDAGTMRMTNVSKLADLFAGTGLGASSSVLSVDAAQTGITSILATDLKIGEDDETKIDFETADEIHFYAANVEQVYLADNIFGPQSDSDVDLGTTGVRWKDAYIDTVTTTGDLDVGGNIELGHASDTTIARASSGVISVEGSNVIMASNDVSALTDSTSAAIGIGTIELGHASDTTIARASGGVISVEGSNVIMASNDVSALTDSTSAAIGIGTIELGHASDTTIARASAGQITVEGTAVILAGAVTGITSLLATDIKIGEDDQTKIDFEDANKINFYANNSKEVELAENSLSPGSNDGTALGTTSLGWSDLFLADEGAIKFGDDQDVTLTHVADTGLTLDGAGSATNLQITNSATDGDAAIQFALGGTVKYTMGVNDGASDAFEINVGTGALGADTTALSIASDGSITFAGPIKTDAFSDQILFLNTNNSFAYNLWKSSASGGSTIQNTAGKIILDSTTAIELDSASGDITFMDGGTAQLSLDMDGTSGEVIFQLNVDSDDLVFKQYDGTEVLRLNDDGSTLVSGNATFGADDTGVDVRIFSATASEGVLYDASEDELALLLTTKLKFHDVGGGEEIFASSDGHLEINAGTTLDMTAPSVDVNADTVTLTSANSQDPLVVIKNTTNDANGARLQFVKDKGAAGADGDDIGVIEFVGDDAGQTQTTFAKIVAEVSEADNTDEAGKLSLFVAESDGTTTALTAGLVLEGEHATDGQVDVTIAAGTSSITTIAGGIAVQGVEQTSANASSVALTTSGLSGLTAGANGSNDTYTLANGEVAGQIKEIALLATTNPSSVDNQVITVATAGWNTDSDPDGIITMTTQGDFIRLMWLNPGSGFVWVPIIRLGNTSLSD
tara:strand:- start:5961 stop:9305 length:3345 start_codon:yes stop_codon:yes gene_type:complete